jgi:hypothetical protein
VAEEVQIGNVGSDGVASEVTLARLTATMELMAKKKGVNPADIAKKMQTVMDDSAKYIKVNTESTKENTKAADNLTKSYRTLAALGGIFGGVFGTLSSSIGGFRDALMQGSGNLEDYAKHVPLFGSSLGFLAGIIDTNINAFRDLSNVGAIFGDGLNDIRRLSGQAGIPLAEFTELVGSNAERMKYFGGTVAQGATSFAAMSKELRTGPGRQFMMLGYTATELNEALLDYSEFNAVQMGKDRRQNTLTAQGAAGYLKTVEDLAKVTGKRRDQIREELAANLTDQRVRAATAKMTGDQSKAFGASLIQASLAGPALKEAIVDMADGFANDPFTAVLASNSEEFRKNAGNLQNMSAKERNDFFIKVAEEADAYADGLGDSLQGVIAGGGVAGQMAELGAATAGKYAKLTQAQIDEADKAAALEQTRNAGLKLFHETIRNITTGLQDILTNQKMDDDGKPIAGSSILERITSAFSAIADTLGEFIASDVFKTGLANFTQNIQEFIDNFSTFGLGTSLFGGKGIDDDGKEVEIKGLMGDLFGEGGTFAGIMDSLVQGIKSGVGEGVSNFMSDLLDFEIPWGTLFVGGLIGIGAAIAAPVLAIPAGIATAIVAVFGIQFMKGLLSDAWDALKAAFTWTAEVASFFVSGISGLFGTAWESITSIFDFGEEGFSFSKLFDNAWTEVKALFSFAGSTILGLGDLMDTAWTKVTGWMGFGDKTWSFSELFGKAWTTITGIFTFGEEGFSISALMDNVWEVVEGYFSFAGEVWLGIGGLMDAAWTKVTGWMGFGDKTWSFSELMSDAWDSVTSFFSMDTLYSIGDLANEAWKTVTSFFSMDTLYSIGDLANEAWKTVTSFFNFGGGEEGTGFSISSLMTTAWETVTGLFDFGNMELPSISGMFQSIIDKVKGFFTFDFEMPDFKSFLPKWMGGGGATLGDTAASPAVSGSEELAAPSSAEMGVAINGITELGKTQSALASFSSLPTLTQNLESLKKGLDIDGVTSYTSAMEKLVTVLGELNDELSQDNYTGPGLGTNAGSVVSKMDTIGSGGGGNSEQLNSTMAEVLIVLQAIKAASSTTANNTKNIVGSNIARSSVSTIG